MKKSLTRTLYLIALLLCIVGGVVYGIGIAQSFQIDPATGTAVATSLSPLFLVGLVVLLAGSAIALVAWIGALIKLAQSGRWGWFVCMILFSGITMLIYIFAGPEAPAVPARAG